MAGTRQPLQSSSRSTRYRVLSAPRAPWTRAMAGDEGPRGKGPSHAQGALPTSRRHRALLFLLKTLPVPSPAPTETCRPLFLSVTPFFSGSPLKGPPPKSLY